MSSSQDFDIGTAPKEVTASDAALHTFTSLMVPKRLWGGHTYRGCALRGVLLVDLDVPVLKAESILLTCCGYYVTPAFSNGELLLLRDTKAVALAILSDRLIRVQLAVVARTARKHWPQTRILVLGDAAPLLEDLLYDDQVHHSLDLKQLPYDLEILYQGLWNQFNQTLDWDGRRAALCFAHHQHLESKSTTTVPSEHRP